MWALWWCVGFLGVLPFLPLYLFHHFISSSIWSEPKSPKGLKN